MALLAVAVTGLALAGCGDTGTDPAEAVYRDGSSPDLALQLPPIAPPPPKQPVVVIDHSVIRSGTVYFENTLDSTMRVRLRLVDEPLGLNRFVGDVLIQPYQARSMDIVAEYTSPEYRDSDWSLRLDYPGAIEVVAVAIR